MKTYATFDYTQLPVIVISFTGAKSTDENFSQYLDELRSCYNDEKNIAIIFDASNASIPSISHQKMQADWLKKHTKLMTSFCKGTAYVIPNTIIRAVLKAIFSIQKQPVSYTIVKTITEAEEWSKNQLNPKN